MIINKEHVLMDAVSGCRNVIKIEAEKILKFKNLTLKSQWRIGGWGGVQTPPQKIRRYRWSPRSHEQEEPASQFPFVVHCVLIRCSLLNKGFF